jgi:hypothetical protein
MYAPNARPDIWSQSGALNPPYLPAPIVGMKLLEAGMIMVGQLKLLPFTIS